MGKNKKKKQTEAAKEEAEAEEDAEFNQMLAEFKQDDVEQGRHAKAQQPAALVRTQTHTHTRTRSRARTTHTRVPKAAQC